MADTNDTIDGLLAEFRGYAAGMPPSYHVTMSWHDFRVMLDRFEAAHKRERGDVAKLRESLYNSNGLLEELAAIGEWGESAREQIAENNAALSAPPRNCDVIGNTGRALAVHGFPTKSKPWGEGEWLKLIDWLFAPYEEGCAK